MYRRKYAWHTRSSFICLQWSAERMSWGVCICRLVVCQWILNLCKQAAAGYWLLFFSMQVPHCTDITEDV